MTVYISRKANLKVNVGVSYERARNFLLLIFGGLLLVAALLIAVCIHLNSQFVRVNIEAGEYVSASDILGEGATFGEDFDPDSVNHAGVYYFNVKLGGDIISMPTVKKMDGDKKIIFRLLNNTPDNVESFIEINGARFEISFGKYEVKTVVYDDGALSESYELLI